MQGVEQIYHNILYTSTECYYQGSLGSTEVTGMTSSDGEAIYACTMLYNLLVNAQKWLKEMVSPPAKVAIASIVTSGIKETY